jgi:hypothetical protein
LLISVAGIIAFFLLWGKKRNELDILFAGAICLTIWISPHVMIYDWSLLLIPALLLWNRLPRLRPLLKSLYALIWIVSILSGPMTYAQLSVFTFAIQISIPVLGFVLVNAYKAIQAGDYDSQTTQFQA